MRYYVTANTLRQLKNRRNQLAHLPSLVEPKALRHCTQLLAFFEDFLQDTVLVETDANGWHHFPDENGQLLDEGLGFRFFLPDGLALPDYVLDEALQFARNDADPKSGFASLDGNGCFCQLRSEHLGSHLWQMIEWLEVKMEYRPFAAPHRAQREDCRKVSWGPQVCIMEPDRPWKDARDMMEPNYGSAYTPLLAVSEQYLATLSDEEAVKYTASYLQKQDSSLFDGSVVGIVYSHGIEFKPQTKEGDPMSATTERPLFVCHLFAPLEKLCDPESGLFYRSLMPPR